MKKITLLKKMRFRISRNGISPRLILSPSTTLVGLKILFFPNTELELLNKHFLSLKLMKNVIYLIEKALMIFFLKDSVIGLVQVVVKPLN